MVPLCPHRPATATTEQNLVAHGEILTLPEACSDAPLKVAANVCDSDFDTAVSVWRITEDRSKMVCVERNDNDDSDQCSSTTGSLQSYDITWDAYPGVGTNE